MMGHTVISLKNLTGRKTPENGFIFHTQCSAALFKTVLTLCLCQSLHTLNWRQRRGPWNKIEITQCSSFKRKQTGLWPSGDLGFSAVKWALTSKIEVTAAFLSWDLMSPFLWGIFVQIWLPLTNTLFDTEGCFAVQTQHKTEVVMLIEHWNVTYRYLRKNDVFAWLKSKYHVQYDSVSRY